MATQSLAGSGSLEGRGDDPNDGYGMPPRDVRVQQNERCRGGVVGKCCDGSIRHNTQRVPSRDGLRDRDVIADRALLGQRQRDVHVGKRRVPPRSRSPTSGARVYKPRMIILIGRDSNFTDGHEKRRLEAQLESTRILTFDELVRVARLRQLD